MSYQALYRKYRPQRFADVIGQEHITSILKNQVTEGHAAHAYLFAGTRGTGKTTTARIFARAVNCLHPVDGEPCGECEACRISADVNADIVEMDAASNSGVEDIRALLEKVRFTPLQLRTKVYIIDEAHALSNQAFNAMLKTLEEPPAHLIFILATTEPQKLPATILSRCQRLDFHRLRIGDMTALLSDVLKKCGASIEEEGLIAIARAADGGMRDCLSLADQCLSFCGDRVSAKDVYSVLGSMDGSFLFTMAEALIEGNGQKALQLLEQVVHDGRDLTVFTHDLTLHMRSLLIAKLCGHASDVLDCTEEAMRAYMKQAKDCGENWLLQAVEQLTKAQADLKWMSLPRVRIESALVRIAKPEEKNSIEGLLARIEALEQKLAKGISLPAPQAEPRKAPAAPAPQRELPPEAPDLPPWEDADIPMPTDCPPETEGAEREFSRPAAKQMPAAASEALPSRAASAPAAPMGAQSPEQAWQHVLDTLKSSDVVAWTMAGKGKPGKLENGQLTVYFEMEIYCTAFNRVREKIETLTGQRVLGVQKGKNSAEEQARSVFGSILEVIKE